MTDLLHELISKSMAQRPSAAAVKFRNTAWTYTELWNEVESTAAGLLQAGLERQDRVAVYLPKQLETVPTMFGAARAGCIFVPVNPLLKPEQVAHILRDCNVRVLVTSPSARPSSTQMLRALPRPAHARPGRRRSAARAARAHPRSQLERVATSAARAAARTASSTPTWLRSSTRPAAPASRKASCCRTATW